VCGITPYNNTEKANLYLMKTTKALDTITVFLTFSWFLLQVYTSVWALNLTSLTLNVQPFTCQFSVAAKALSHYCRTVFSVFSWLLP